MEEKKTLLFIFNPFSGKAQIKNQLMDIVDTMVKAGYEVTIYPTQAPEDAIHKVEVDAEKYDLVVCSGGDGTLDEVVSGIMHKGLTVPLGYIPAGSTNDFATSLGIPKDMVKAADAAVNGRTFPCDIGAFNFSIFLRSVVLRCPVFSLLPVVLCLLCILLFRRFLYIALTWLLRFRDIILRNRNNRLLLWVKPV